MTPAAPLFEATHGDGAPLVVLELASVLAGPSVGQFFAELGAAVIKVENLRTEGDVTRRWRLPQEAADAGRSSYFAACNWGKKSVALDLKTAAGRRLVQDLAGRSDVVLASYKPGDAEQLGVDAATLCARNPRLIYAHLTGYGSDDARAGYDAVIQAESGFMHLNGEADGPPLKMPVALMDILAAHQLKEALLLALLRRTQTGQGTTLHVSLLQSAVSALVNQATNWLVAGVAPVRTGSEHPNIVPYGTAYATADGPPIVLAVGTDRQFAALCAVLGCPALADDARFATNTARVAHRAALHPLLQQHMARQAHGALLAALVAQRVPAGAINDLPRVFEQPQAEALLLHDAPAAPGLTGLRQAAFSSPDLPLAHPAPPPAYGADTGAVLQAYLGLTDEAVQRLAAEGVLYQAPADV